METDIRKVCTTDSHTKCTTQTMWELYPPKAPLLVPLMNWTRRNRKSWKEGGAEEFAL